MYLVHGVGEEEVKAATLAYRFLLVAGEQFVELGFLLVLGKHLQPHKQTLVTTPARSAANTTR